jgi:hypothetical protein
MIENKIFSYMFAICINHAGFIVSEFIQVPNAKIII